MGKARDMTFCLSAIDPAASKSVTFLQNLAGNPKNVAFKSHLEAAAIILLDRAEDAQELKRKVETLELEILKMARDFVSAVDVVLAHDASVTTQVATLTATNAQLTADLAAAQANATTPETLAAQQKVIDRAEAVSPSTPVVPPVA